jgi:hypothetical protein
MRNMSFSLTTDAYRRGDKSVTRRLGWRYLRPGDRVMGVEKAMGLKKGEKIVQLHPFEVLSNESEPLMDIVRRPYRNTRMTHETSLEGFPGMTSTEFVEMFTEHNGCDPEDEIQRIELRHLWQLPAVPRQVTLEEAL